MYSSKSYKLNKKITDEDLHEYYIMNRLDFIDTLIDWISEAKGSDKVLMKEDLKMLINREDDFLFSSNSTNDYIGEGDHEFDEICEEILKINSSL